MNDLIVLATYWNEIEWIESSLAQIELLKPKEIIICDGNFDSGVPNYSTDGTREVIDSFVAENKSRATVVSALRINPFMKFSSLYGSSSVSSVFKLSRFKMALKSHFRLNIYRVNQSLTFAYMSRLSKYWKSGNWVLTLDADQFYSDDMINAFHCNFSNLDCDLMLGSEYTFPFHYSEYTEDYETRKWNNMPHRIKKNTAIYPTRHIVREEFARHFEYHEMEKAIDVGYYCHYKFRKNIERQIAGYSLGDRKPPDSSRYSNLKKFTLDHPVSVRRSLLV